MGVVTGEPHFPPNFSDARIIKHDAGARPTVWHGICIHRCLLNSRQEHDSVIDPCSYMSDSMRVTNLYWNNVSYQLFLILYLLPIRDRISHYWMLTWWSHKGYSRLSLLSKCQAVSSACLIPFVSYFRFYTNPTENAINCKVYATKVLIWNRHRICVCRRCEMVRFHQAHSPSS